MIHGFCAIRPFALAAALVSGLAITSRSGAFAQAQIPLTLERLEAKGTVASAVTLQGRQAIRLLESDKSRNTLGLAIVKDVTFANGTIEVDVAGQRGPYAVPDDRGFIGVAFRISPGAERFEYIYLRPDNGRAADQVRRNHSTQYASHPDFPWPRLRKGVSGEIRNVRGPSPWRMDQGEDRSAW